MCNSVCFPTGGKPAQRPRSGDPAQHSHSARHAEGATDDAGQRGGGGASPQCLAGHSSLQESGGNHRCHP